MVGIMDKKVISDKLDRLWKFMKLLRVEPFLFLLMFQWALKGMPSHQLVQDKICMNWYNTTAKYCHDLPELKESGDQPGQYKNMILADVAQFGTYGTYLNTIPSLIWAMFVGAWIDRYAKGRKMLMMLGVAGTMLENVITIYTSISFDKSVYYNLMSHIPTSILGGHIASRIAITHYMASTTPPKLMATRFMFFEIFMFIAFPIGQVLGGYILVQEPVFAYGEIRNYTVIFIVALFLEVLTFLGIVFMVNERIARKQERKIEMKIQGIKDMVDSDGKPVEIELKTDMKPEDKGVHPIKLLFDLKNVKTMMATVVKKRSNRAQLILFMVAMIISFVIHVGAHQFDGQFLQRVYQWAPDWMSYMKSVNLVAHSIATLTLVPFMIRVLKIQDLLLAIIGYGTFLVCSLIKGFWLDPMAYYVSIPISSIGGISLIGTRAYLTKIVGRDELGKVMSFMATVDTIAPALSNTLFAYIFKYTITSYPGTIFQVSAFLTLIPIAIMIWIYCMAEPQVKDKEIVVEVTEGQEVEVRDKILEHQVIQRKMSISEVLEKNRSSLIGPSSL